jgi:hypothetical protein
MGLVFAKAVQVGAINSIPTYAHVRRTASVSAHAKVLPVLVLAVGAAAAAEVEGTEMVIAQMAL